jgi:hypothetical protein
VTESITILAWAFHTRYSSTSVVPFPAHQLGGRPFENSSGGDTMLYARVMLPPGSTVTHVEFGVFGNAATDMLSRLTKQIGTDSIALEAVGTLGATPDRRIATAETITSAAVGTSTEAGKVSLLRWAIGPGSGFLVEESVCVIVVGDVGGDFPAADRQSLAPGMHGLTELVEQDLERTEALIEEVFGLVLQSTRVGFGGLHDLASTLLSSTHDFGSLHHTLGTYARCLEQLVGFAASFRYKVLAFLEHPSGLTQLVRQPVQGLFEEFDDLVTIDAWR